MSADDFQSRYASVMESVVRSAIAETTKLFETMVNDLKAEISRIKKENDDLKSRCTEFENVININMRKSQPYPGPIDAADKRDTAIQCDLVPQAMLMELSQSFRNSSASVPNQEQQGFGETGECLQKEQSSESHGGGHSQVASVVVKQEEDIDPVVICREIINSIADSPGDSAGRIEAEGPCVSQAHSNEELTLRLTNEETLVALEVPSKAMDSRRSCSGGIQSHTPEPEHQLVNSNAAVNGDIGEKYEVSPHILETWTQVEMKASEEQPLVIAQQQSVGEPIENEKPTELEHLEVIAHAAINDDMEEQCEVSEHIMQTHCKEVEPISSEEQPPTQQQSEIEPLEQEQQSVVPQHHQRDVEMPVKEQMCVIVQQDASVPCTDENVSEAPPFNSEGACQELEDDEVEDQSCFPHQLSTRHTEKSQANREKHFQSQPIKEKDSSFGDCPRDRNVMFSTTIGVAEVEVSSHPESQVCPPRRMPKTTILSPSQKSRKTLTSSSSINISSVMEAVSTPLREMKIIRRGNSSRKRKPPQSQQLEEVEENATQTPSTEDPSAAETCNTSSAKSSQAGSVAPRERRLSHASLQDALLFVEAMNAQTVECEPTMENASSQTSCAPPLVTLKTEAEDTAKISNPLSPQTSGLPTTPKTVQKFKVGCPTTIVTTTIPQACMMEKVVIPCNTASPHQPLDSPNIASSPNTMVVPRMVSSVTPRTVSVLSETQLSSVVSTVIASHKNKLPPAPPANPPHSPVPLKTLVVPSKKSLPLVRLLPTATSTLPPPKLTVVIPRRFSTVARRQQHSSLPHKIIITRRKSVQTNPTVAVSVTKPVSSTQQSSVSADTQTGEETATLPQKRENISENPESHKQTASVSMTTHVPTESCSLSPGLAQTSVSPAIPPIVQPKLSAVVKLTRLPFPLTTKESVLVQETLNGSIEALSIVGNSFNVRPNDTEETTVKAARSVSAVSSRESAPTEASATSLQESNSVSEISTACGPTSSLDADNKDVQEVMFLNNLPIPIRLTSIISKDTDPHLQMSKTQFLAQLAVSPVQVQQKDFSSNSGDGIAVCAESSTSNNSRALERSSLVARLRSHLKACLKAEGRNLKPESLTETEPPVSSKNPGLADSANDGNISTQPIAVRPPTNQAVTEDEASLKNTSKYINSISPRTSRLCKDGVRAKKTASEANCVSPRRSTLAKHSASPKNNASELTFTSPSKSCLTKNGARSKRTSDSLRTYSSRRDDAKTKKIKLESSSPATKWSRSAKDGASPKKKRKPTPAIKPTSTAKKSPSVMKSEKLAKAAKTKKLSTLTELQNGAKKSTKSDASRHTGKKYKAKAVWTPPRMPANNSLSKMERSLKDGQLSSPNRSHAVKPKTSPSSSPHPVVYPPSVSLLPIPVRAPPIVSPLQPLSVIGWRLLRNQCGACGRVLSSAAALESHVSLHTGRRPFSCKLCGKGFPDSKGLKRHGRVHRNGRIHVCPKCGKGFVYSFGLTKHVRVVHSKIKPFVCLVCPKAFFTKRDMEAHMRVHTGEKPFHCNLCEKQFARRVELNVHLRWHNGEKRHWCPYCGKGFLDSNNLKRHKYIHTGEKPHPCPHCPKRFTQSGHLKKHVKNVHKIQ